jgi:hypothetical protein
MRTAMSLRLKAVSGACILLAWLGAVSLAQAEPASLRDFLFGAKRPGGLSLPAIARYQSERGESFVLDRSAGRNAVLKFDDNSELYALTASPGPRGDVIYRNDVGEPVLRATRLGGLTLFTPGDPGGTAVAALGSAPPPRPPVVFGPEGLFQVLVQASSRASRAAQHLIIFDAGDAVATPSTEPIFADAFILTADAIVRVSSRGAAGHAACAHLAKVHFVQGGEAAALVTGRIVQITIAPDLGVAGRPSSERIAAALFRR